MSVSLCFVPIISNNPKCITLGIDESKINDYFDMGGIITFTYEEKSFSVTLNDDGSVKTLWYGDSGIAEAWLVEDNVLIFTLK